MDTSSDSDAGSGAAPPARRLFGRERPIHNVLGGGEVANVLLWRDIRVSAAILMGIAALWFLFEVVEYSFIAFACHLCITTMLLVFIWSSASDFLHWDPPNIPSIILQDSTIRDFVSTFHRKTNQFLEIFLFVATGNDPKLFFLIIVSLGIVSVIASSIGSLNFLFFGILCLETLPFLYEMYEDEVDKFGVKLSRKIKKYLRKFPKDKIN
ncbi:reticulon-like protein B9 [Andrographis paniculata]|uniref:reticulon-like protein B9 n=1 Tax=Andrographis paniculata TaxID=175694 RepID=UPI0021E70984|nr:reticulon-like protein B9 [Andrographis paniculata]